MIEHRSNNFDRVAKFYDALARIVFGRSMFNAQTFYLREISADAKVLIIGGGTGWLLNELTKINVTCTIWYIESSEMMLELSRHTAKHAKQEIQFILGTEASIPSDIQYDVVITNFFLDLFPTASCDRIIGKIRHSLHRDSQWIMTDFENLTWWHAAMLRAMYIFFKLASAIEASQLPPFESLFIKYGMAVRKSEYFYGRFIKTSLLNLNDKVTIA
jgi:tRNA (cmo5U34)-methyltransferase